MNKKLRKSAKDVVLVGVCGGIAEFFGLDTTQVRWAWILLSLFGGAGILLYIILAIIMPEGDFF